MKILKKGLQYLIKKHQFYLIPRSKILLYIFNLHHGNGNLDKAISVLDQSDQEDFFQYVNTKTSFNPHLMFIAKPIST